MFCLTIVPPKAEPGWRRTLENTWRGRGSRCSRPASGVLQRFLVPHWKALPWIRSTARSLGWRDYEQVGEEICALDERMPVGVAG